MKREAKREDGADVFWVLSESDYSDEGRRVICDYVFYQSRAVRETICELVRNMHFQDKPSGLKCLFVCNTLSGGEYMKYILGTGKRFTAVLLALLIVTGSIRVESFAAGSVSIAEGLYYIVPYAGDSVSVCNVTPAAGNNLVVRDRDNGGSNLIQVRSLGNNSYELLLDEYALDASGGRGRTVKLETPNRSNAQKWVIKDAGNGYVNIHPYGNESICLDLSGGSTMNDTNVLLWEYWGGENQRWKLIPWEGTSVSGCSLTITEGTLGMNFFLSGIPVQTAKEGYVTIDGSRYSFSDRQSDGSYRFTHYVNAKDVGRSLRLQLYTSEGTNGSFVNGNEAGGTFAYSVKEYLSVIAAGNDDMGRLAEAIMLYGDCAHNYFYEEEEPIPVTVKEILLKDYEKKESGRLPEGIRYYGSSLLLRESFTIRHYFQVERLPETGYLSITADGRAVEAYEQDGLYYIELPGILSWNVDKPCELVIDWGDGVYRLTYSVLSYASDAASQKAEDDRLCQLVKSIYWYGKAIKRCVSGEEGMDYREYMNSSYPYDMPKAQIIVPAKPTGEEEAAAYILQQYIEKEDGYRPSVISDGAPVSGETFEISVGNTNRPHGTPRYSSEDSYSIRSYENGVSLTGVGRLGLMHGAMRFLEACGGYFYMSWNDLLVTNQEHFRYDSLNGISIDYERPFLYTDTDLCYSFLNPRYDETDPNRGLVGTAGYVPSYTGRLYSLAFGFNGTMSDNYALPENMPGRRSWYLSTEEGYYESTGAQVGTAHTLMEEFVDADVYFASHPEWFCASNDSQGLDGENYVPDSKKTRNKTQLCFYMALHDPTLYNILLQHCYDMIEAGYDPEAPMQIISLSKADNEFLCSCDYCVQERFDYGNTERHKEAYQVLALLNKLSEDLHRGGRYDNLYLDTLAYVWTLRAPVGMKADEHVIIRFAPIERCYGHYLDCDATEDLRNSELYPELLSWLSIAQHVWIWEYNTNFRITAGPYANVDVMQHDIKLYKRLGIEGIYMQSNDRHYRSNTEFGDIRNYIVGRMLQDPARDYEAELAFFTDAFYGEKSGAYVREYQRRMEKQMGFHQQKWEYRDKIATCFATLYDVYADERRESDGSHRMPDDEVAACEACWRNINEAAAEETEERQLRLKRLLCSWRLVKSTLRVYEFADAASYQKENNRLLADMKATGAICYSIIGGYNLSQCTRTNLIPDFWVSGVDTANYKTK